MMIWTMKKGIDYENLHLQHRCDRRLPAGELALAGHEVCAIAPAVLDAIRDDDAAGPLGRARRSPLTSVWCGGFGGGQAAPVTIPHSQT